MEESNFPDSKYLSKGIWERRIHTGPGYRIYFAKRNAAEIVLLGGGAKHSQVRDIQRAQDIWTKHKAEQA